MLYAQKFFKTKEKAQAFQKTHGGALYEGVPGSRTLDDYRLEACLAELTAAERAAKPYCVAWTVVDEGPIKPDEIEHE